MTDEELREWNDYRLQLFAGCRIPPNTLAAILHDARRLDFDRAMRALPIYRAAKPYKGFYVHDWNSHYQQTSALPESQGRTDGAAARAAAAREEEVVEVELQKLAEARAYAAIPPADRLKAREQLAYLGWPTVDNSRAWRIIVTMWHRGEDVSSLMHPSKLCKSLPEAKDSRISREEMRRELLAIIAGAKQRLAEIDAGGAL
jgi:hypothetical protein